MNLPNTKKNYVKISNNKISLSGIIGVIFVILLIIIAFFIFAIVDPAHADTRLLDSGFADPNIGGTDIRAIKVQSDGKILIGGDFTSAGGSGRTYLARFNSDGTLDTAFSPGLSSKVHAIAVQSDGKILAGGDFSTAGGAVRRGLARFASDGTLDATFDPSLDTFGGSVNNVFAIAVQNDGKILVGGNFMVAGSGRRYLVRLASDGTLDPAFNASMDSDVRAIAVQSDGKILAGGTFTSAGGSARTYLARFGSDGALDATFNPSLDNGVYAIAMQTDGKLLIGGGFTLGGSAGGTRLARLGNDGTLEAAFSPNLNNTVLKIAVQGNGKILAAGGFTSANGTGRQRLARFENDGTLDASFNPGLDGWARAMEVQGDGKIVVGGDFTTADSLGRGRLARFFSGRYALSLTPPANGSVTSSPAGIACGATCSAVDIGGGTQLTLTATPASGYRFAGWGGGCSGSTNPLTLTLAADTACTAIFSADGPVPAAPPAPPPAFVTTPLPPALIASTAGSASGSFSFASSFANPSGLTFTATQGNGVPLPSWLTFTPGSVSFAYDLPIPADLPFQSLGAADRKTGRVDARASSANTIYPPLLRVAQVPITLTATGNGQSYAPTIRVDFHAPRLPVAMSGVSFSLDGAAGNGRSGRSALSWDGGQMVFETAATNLFPAAPNSHGTIVRYQALSGDRDRLSQTAIPGGGVANAAAGPASSPAVSSDGRYAAFAADAPGITLIPTGGVRQVYRTALGYPRVPLNEQATPAPELVSATAAGMVGNGHSDNPGLSQDGRYVVFESTATNFATGLDGTIQVWRKDLQTGALDAVSNGPGRNASVSWDGHHIAFERNGLIHLRDMVSGTVVPLVAGTQPRLTARADRVAYVAAVGGIAQIMVVDLAGGAVRAVTSGNGPSDQPAISADGRFVVFRSGATDLVPGYAGNGLAQIFVRDIERGVTMLVTRAAAGGPASGASWNPTLSGDGGTISFASDARDLVNGNPAAGQAYLSANPLPLPGKTGYWTMTGIGGGQGWVMERWGNQAYVGGLAYDALGRSQWLAGFCTLSGLTCSGMLTGGPAFSMATAETDTGATLVVGGMAGQTLAPFPIGGNRTAGYAGLPQAGWWYEPEAGNGIGYFLDIDTQPQPDGSVAQVGYLAVLGYDAAGRQVWQTAQATLAADLSLSGTLVHYAGGAPFGAVAAALPASGSVVGPVRMTFEGTDRALIRLPDGRTAGLARFRF